MILFSILTIPLVRAREMIQGLKALAAFLEDPGSIPSPHLILTNVCKSSPRVSDNLTQINMQANYL